MKARRYILSAATALLIASPLAATAGSAGEGTMWIELRDLHAQLTHQPGTMAAGERAGMAGPVGPMGDQAPGERLSRVDTRGEISLFEKIAERHREQNLN